MAKNERSAICSIDVEQDIGMWREDQHGVSVARMDALTQSKSTKRSGPNVDNVVDDDGHDRLTESGGLLSLEPKNLVQMRSELSRATVTSKSIAPVTIGEAEQDISESGNSDHGACSPEIYTLIQPRLTAKKPGTNVNIDEEPLIDTTEALPLKSKKIERQQKKRERKMMKTTVQSDVRNFLELPPELLEEVLGYLNPSDLFLLLRLNKSTRQFISEHETSIARCVIRRRYWVLSQTFPLPVLLEDVEPVARACLLTANWQERLRIHKTPYQQFISMHEPDQVCSCMTCVFAWNHLNLILDLAHFQNHLSAREPIPMIPRGTCPEWNTTLITSHAALVRRALTSPLSYARILQTHLSTTVATLTRRIHFEQRLYKLSASDIAAETDAFLERRGPPNFEMPVHRDNYYKLEAYVPNRKWEREAGRWTYFSAKRMHETDMRWVANNERFQPDRAPHAGIEKFVQSFLQMREAGPERASGGGLSSR